MSFHGREIQVNSVNEIGNLTESVKPILSEVIEVIIEVDMKLIDQKMIQIEPVQILIDIGLTPNGLDPTPTVKKPEPSRIEKEMTPTELKVNGAIQTELEVILIDQKVTQIEPKVKSAAAEPKQNGQELKKAMLTGLEVNPTEINVIQTE